MISGRTAQNLSLSLAVIFDVPFMYRMRVLIQPHW